MTDKLIIRSLLTPINGGQVLLPSAVIAEVTSYRQLERVDTPPDWFLGILQWRGQQVPMVCIEKILSLTPVPPTFKHCIVILYGLESPQLPFYGFLAVDVPRVIAISEESLTHPTQEGRPGLAFSVTLLNQDTVWLPDLAYVENSIRKWQASMKHES